MRLTFVGLFGLIVFSLVVSETLAAPAKKGIPPIECVRPCDPAYKPICGQAKNSSKERLLTFGSECVMHNYNCGHPNEKFEVKMSGECPGMVDVRLQ